MSEGTHTEIRPQQGRQEEFLASSADICIYGGSAGSGKTWGLLAEPLRHVNVKGFYGVFFRRVMPQITNVGGLWDEATELYDTIPGSQAYKSPSYRWEFPSGSRLSFNHLQYDDTRLDWKGAQICYLAFDQLEEFSEVQFFYLISRNRSTCGVQPYIRATVNPDADSWVADFISWWIDDESGYAIPERSGVLRWMIRGAGDELKWFDSEAEALDYRESEGLSEHLDPKSVTFIPATIFDNRILLEKDKTYLSNLYALPLVERMRLLGDEELGGNWKIRPTAGKVFNRAWFKMREGVASDDQVKKRIRYWDKAASEKKGSDYSAGVKMALLYDGTVVVESVVRGRWSSLDRERIMRETAKMDGKDVEVWIEREPGSSGVDSAKASVRNLGGFTAYEEPVTGDKYSRARPLSAQVEAGHVYVTLAAWNEDYLHEMHQFDGTGKGHDDQVDASSGAYNRLTLGKKPIKVAFGKKRGPKLNKSEIRRQRRRLGARAR